jgi:hypothetical protein
MTTIVFDNNEYTITLIREGKKVEYKFLASCGTLCIEKEADVMPDVREKIIGSAFDGMLYYIYFHSISGKDETHIWLSKEEFDILDPLHMNFEEMQFCEDSEEHVSYELDHM